MLDIKSLLTENKEKINGYVTKYIEVVNLLKEFIAAPSETTNKIVNNKVLPEALISDFKDIQRGLLGEFSKTQSVEIGKHKIINYIEEILQTIKKDYISIEGIIKNTQTDILPNLKVMETETDFDLIGRRQTRYAKNALTIKFFNTKLVTTLEPKLLELSLNINAREFLFKLEGALAAVRTMDFNKLVQDWDTYKKSKEFLTENYKNAGNNSFLNSKYEITSSIDEVDFNTYFKDLLNKIEITDNIEITDMDLLNRIIDTLPRTLKVLKENAESLLSTLKSFVDTNPGSFLAILVSIYETALEPYAKASITADEFNNRIKDSVITINNGLAIDNDIIIKMVNNITELEKGMRLYLYVYQLVNEVTLKGVIE